MLTKKKKGLLSLLSKSETVSKIRLVKTSFLVSNKTDFYSFVPYKFGPFSFELYHDLSSLEKHGFVSLSQKNITLLKDDFKSPGPKLLGPISEILDRFSGDTDKTLTEFVYDFYPEYTVFSEYKKKMNYTRDETGIITAGYEGKTIDTFLFDLHRQKVNVLVDVRRNAFSMKYGFSKSQLKALGEKLGIDYLHIPDLGIPSHLRKDLKTYDDYLELFKEYKTGLKSKQKYLEVLKELGKKQRIALMCFEKDVRFCHRGVIAKTLLDSGAEVVMDGLEEQESIAHFEGIS
jgi:uncharacterized protein (DUF488 family)